MTSKESGSSSIRGVRYSFMIPTDSAITSAPVMLGAYSPNASWNAS